MKNNAYSSRTPGAYSQIRNSARTAALRTVTAELNGGFRIEGWLMTEGSEPVATTLAVNSWCEELVADHDGLTLADAHFLVDRARSNDRTHARNTIREAVTTMGAELRSVSFDTIFVSVDVNTSGAGLTTSGAGLTTRQIAVLEEELLRCTARAHAIITEALILDTTCEMIGAGDELTAFRVEWLELS